VLFHEFRRDVAGNYIDVGRTPSWAVQSWEAMRQVVQNYTTGPKGLAQVGYKDVSLAVTVGHDVGASLPVAALVGSVAKLIVTLCYLQLVVFFMLGHFNIWYSS
jgi:hypothetical protein